MCGIAGFWKPFGNKLGDQADQQLNGMLRSQEHRGPDGKGTYFNRDLGLALGHARLTIIDLNTGAQPLHNPNKTLSLVVNGEIYNYKHIRSKLMTEGYEFSTKSDSEIIMPLYKKHGLDFMQYLRGEFAFSLFDHEKQTLALARDRFGIRPLFYYNSGKNLYFGSEVKVLLAHPDVPKKLSRRATLNQLMHTMVPGTTAFEGIHAIKPGHMLIVKPNGTKLDIQEKSYWDLNFPKQNERDGSLSSEHFIDQVREKLVDAVTYRLEADVPVGCYLSGGIDSCCILGMASGAMQSPVKAFTIAFDNTDYDESQIAKEMAASVGADQDIIHLTGEELYGTNFIRTAYHAERTFYNTLGVAKWCMSKHVREAEYKTVITGEGSDELFGGYPAFKRDMFLHGISHEDASTRAELQEALARSNKLFQGAILSENPESHPAFEELCGFTPSWIQSWLATLKIARPLLSDPCLAELNDTQYDPIYAITSQIDPKKISGRHPLDIAQYTWSKTMLEGQILNWGGDRVDMANSMESRPAFLDHHVAELAVRVPPSMRVKGNIEKWVLREAMKGVLPEVLYKREKFAFMAPPAHTDYKKKNRVQLLIDHYLSSESINDCGMLDSSRVHQFLKDYQSDKDPTSLVRKDALLNHLLSLHIVHRHLIVGEKLPEN
ncbi:MAG: asparagine synthase (glutamine-hydrolyzing) [Verrucomicrobiota bacterium]